MARWQRDPKARRNVAAVLAAAEVLAGSLVFLVLAFHYALRLAARLVPGAAPFAWVAAVALTVPLAAWLVYESVLYVKGQEWARRLFIGCNLALVAAGLLWFAASLVAGGRSPDALWYGLGLPMLTLFPLTAPLLACRPTADAGPSARPAPPGPTWR